LEHPKILAWCPLCNEILIGLQKSYFIKAPKPPSCSKGMPPGRGEEEGKVRGGRKGKREIVGDEVRGGGGGKGQG